MRAEKPPLVRALPSSNPLCREAPALRGGVAGLATTPARSVQVLEFMRPRICSLPPRHAPVTALCYRDSLFISAFFSGKAGLKTGLCRKW
jgi:hypothetical protein